MQVQPDRWSSWLLQRRDAGSERQRSIALEHLSEIRDRLLASFERVHAECYITIEPGSLMNPVNFDALLDSAPNPNAPTAREAIAAALTKPEQKRFLSELERSFIEGTPMQKWPVRIWSLNGPSAPRRARAKPTRYAARSR